MIAPYQVPLIKEISRHVSFTAMSIVKVPPSRLSLGWSKADTTSILQDHNYPSISLPTPIGTKELSLSVFDIRLYLDNDVIIVGGYASLSSLVAIAFTKLFRKKLVIRTGTHELSVSNPSIFLRYLKSLILRQAHTLIAYGTQASLFARNLGFKKSIFTEYDTVDVGYFARRASEFRSDPSNVLDFKKSVCNISDHDIFHIVYVGQLIPRKNLSVLISSISVLVDFYGLTKFRISIFGSGADKSDLLRQINALNLSDYFTFCSSIPYDSIYKAYCSAHLLLVPSLKDPYPLVVNEAMACNTPVLLSRNCGNSFDFHSDANPCFVLEDSLNVWELAAKLHHLINNQTLLDQETSRINIIRRYDIKNAASAFIKAIND